MPVNPSHAYARGRIFRDRGPSFGFSIVRRLFDWFEDQQAALVWESFRKHSSMGNDCYLGPNAWCTNYGKREDITLGNQVYCRGILRCGTRGAGRILIGDEVYIGDDSIISSESRVEIGLRTMISHGVHIFDTTGHPVDAAMREQDWLVVRGKMPGPRPVVDSSPVHIGRRVWLGFNCVVMRGVTIGDNAVVAACSVVVDDVPPDTVVAGNPARIVKRLSEDMAAAADEGKGPG